MSGATEHVEIESPRRPIVLVAEDDVVQRAAVAEYLRRMGYTVIEAANGNEAFEVLRLECSADLVFSDIQMPMMSGIELARWVVENCPGIPVILTSGTRLHEAVPGVSFLPKPYDFAALVERIRVLLGKGAPPTSPAVPQQR
jgi:CheY-like chemotaxis protein